MVKPGPEHLHLRGVLAEFREKMSHRKVRQNTSAATDPGLDDIHAVGSFGDFLC